MTRTRIGLVLGALAAITACTAPVANEATPSSPLVVAVDGGRINGSADGDVRIYKAIPYAAPPIGTLRWQPPQAVVPWDGVRDATRFSPACFQRRRAEDSFYGQIVDQMSEDCLYLNVWTRAQPNAQRPVMVWIHGGALTSGHGGEVTYDGTSLAKRDIVLVTINYRLGALGYLSHAMLREESAQKSSGNYGTLDQIAALKWVQKNIGAFGGDPGRVTIFGESAGSWSVNHLMASPLAKGLFHRAIGESGGGFGSMGGASLKVDAETAGERFVSALLGNGGTPTLEAMRSKSGDEVIAVTGAVSRPNVDGWVLPDTIYNIFAAGRQNDVPVIVGSNADEGTSLGAGGRGAMTVAEYRKYARQTAGSLAEAFLKTYPVSDDADTVEARIDSYTDQTFGWEMRTWARMMDTVSSDAYLYFFSRVAPGADSQRVRAFHAAEIIYVFDNLSKSPYPYANRAYDDTDRKLSNLMASYWVNFATTGNPNAQGLPRWPVYARQADESLEFGDAVQVRAGIRKDRLDFMDRYYADRRGDRN